MSEYDFWLLVRRALLMFVSAIEQREGLRRSCPECENRPPTHLSHLIERADAARVEVIGLTGSRNKG